MEVKNSRAHSETFTRSADIVVEVRKALTRFHGRVLSFEDGLQKLGYIVEQFQNAAQSDSPNSRQLTLVGRINTILLQLRHLLETHAKKFNHRIETTIVVIQGGELDDNSGPSKSFPIRIEWKENVYELFLGLVDGLSEVRTHVENLDEFPVQRDNSLSLAIDAFCYTLRRMVFKGSAGPGYPVLENVDELITFCNRAGSGIEAMTRAMTAFIDFVYPAAQERRLNIISKLQSETAVATFISGVTATTLQISLQGSGSTTLLNVVNGFWFISLIFSVLSALGALLDLLQHYRRHGSIVADEKSTSIWSALWKELPLAFLLVAVASFTTGLVIFPWAIDEDLTIRTISLIFTCLCLIAIFSRNFFGFGPSRKRRDY